MASRMSLRGSFEKLGKFALVLNRSEVLKNFVVLRRKLDTSGKLPYRPGEVQLLTDISQDLCQHSSGNNTPEKRELLLIVI